LSAATRRAIGAAATTTRRRSRSRSGPTFSSASTSGSNTGGYSSASCPAASPHIGRLADSHCSTLCSKHLCAECDAASGQSGDGNSAAE